MAERIYKCISSERYTPYSLARKIGATAVFESASIKKGRDRFSILMTEEAFRIIQDADGVAFLIDGKRVPFVPQQPSIDAMGHKKDADILDALLYVASQDSDFKTKADIPIPASGMNLPGTVIKSAFLNKRTNCGFRKVCSLPDTFTLCLIILPKQCTSSALITKSIKSTLMRLWTNS